MKVVSGSSLRYITWCILESFMSGVNVVSFKLDFEVLVEFVLLIIISDVPMAVGIKPICNFESKSIKVLQQLAMPPRDIVSDSLSIIVSFVKCPYRVISNIRIFLSNLFHKLFVNGQENNQSR